VSGIPQSTVALCGAGVIALPFAWRWAARREVVSLAPLASPLDRVWPAPVAFGYFFGGMVLLAVGVHFRESQPLAGVFALVAGCMIGVLAARRLMPRILLPTIGVGPAIGAGVLTMLAAMPAVYGVAWLQGTVFGEPKPQDLMLVFLEQRAGWQVCTGLVVLLAPLTEELVFRGFLYGGMRRVVAPRTALVLSAFLFGIVHFAPPTTILPMLVFGLFLARLMERTGSILACFVAHATFNAFSVATAILAA
jgi:membrane protease YdiL (CAAX protease family)